MVSTVSADTLIVYASPNYGSIYYSAWNKDYSVFRNYTGTSGVTVDLYTSSSLLISTSTTNKFSDLYRAPIQFNTSTLTSGSTISSAILTITGITGNINDLGVTNYSLTSYSPATNGTNVAGDYDAWGSTRLSDNIAFADMPNNYTTINNFTLNTDGRAYISKVAWTNFMLRDNFDIDNSVPVWAPSKNSGIFFGGERTFMTIVYSNAVSAPVASFTCTKNFIRIPNSVTCTDSSTNTPTSWEWSWGDGTANSTTQNPSHQYLKRGKWDIVMTATNAGGSSTTSATSVKVVGYENYN